MASAIQCDCKNLSRTLAGIRQRLQEARVLGERFGRNALGNCFYRTL
jgi:hypothetical protein